VTDDARPPTLLVAAVLVGLEGLFVCVLAVLEVVALDTDRVALGITTALFFLVLGAGLMFCAWGLFRVRSWARGPVVATELIGVLLSFSFWGGETTLAAVVILLVSLAGLVGVLHPASTRALAADDG
jgi:peptidoglycan/LPS O-acetylase OafA/YrhL